MNDIKVFEKKRKRKRRKITGDSDTNNYNI